MSQLSGSEMELIEQLQGVDANTLWGLAIKDVVQEADPGKVRQLISSLKQQGAENPMLMREILGTTCYQHLTKL